MQYVLIFVLFSAAFHYENDTPTKSTSLNGKWVDVTTTTDTLTFKHIGDNDYMVLGRGMENRNGVMRPKHGSGPYYYKFAKDNYISLRWSLSSDSNFKEYSFSQTENTLTIEKFFDTPAAKTLLTFKKIE